MLLDIRLRNFRSYKDSRFEFKSGINMVVGPNASGKTNLLEGILMITTGRSYRAKDNDLINFDCEWAGIESKTTNGDKRSVKLNKLDNTKLYDINQNNYKRLSVNNILPAVLFEPDHLKLFTTDPETRREFIDGILAQTNPEYTKILRQYSRTLRQRNVLLKQPRNIKTDIFPWNLRLSELGGKIVKLRLSAINDINEFVSDIYSDISKEKTLIKIVYSCQVATDNYESLLLQLLESRIQTDIERGFTTAGPHRDDLGALINNRPSQLVASRGEMRSIILSLKLTELELLQKYSGRQPVLLFDDVFSELDKERRNRLTEKIAPFQTFITSTDADASHYKPGRKINLIRL